MIIHVWQKWIVDFKKRWLYLKGEGQSGFKNFYQIPLYKTIAIKYVKII